MTRRILPALAVAAIAAMPGTLHAAGGEGHVEDYSFSFEGPFGTFDRLQLQRGFQVFKEICSGCHGLKYLSFRALGNADGPGFPDAQVKAIAADFQCTDPELEPGETRACKDSDRFPANTAAGAPDLSLMAKARAGFHGPLGLGVNQFLRGTGGPEYITSLLTGYTGEEVEMAGAVLYENSAFPGGLISMAPPIGDGYVEYTLFNADGSPYEPEGEGEGEGEGAAAGHGGEGGGGGGHGAHIPEPTTEQLAKDVSAFLMWAAEPTMVERKQAGLRNILMLVILAVLLYYTNKKLWAPIKRKAD